MHTMRQDFPNEPLDYLTRAATVFGLMFNGVFDPSANDQEFTDFCELISANVGETVDPHVVRDITAQAYEVGKRGIPPENLLLRIENN
jgi:hypothetical protein